MNSFQEVSEISNTLDIIPQHLHFPYVSLSLVHAQAVHQGKKEKTMPRHDPAFEEAAVSDVWHSTGTESQAHFSTYQLLQLR